LQVFCCVRGPLAVATIFSPKSLQCRDGFEPKSIGRFAWIRANTWIKDECRDRRRAADFTSAPLAFFERFMETSTHDFVTVDMRGLKAALVAHAKARRATVSVVVRDAVAAALGRLSSEGAPPQLEADAARDGAVWVKLSVRVRCDEAHRIDAGAKAAGLSRSAYLVGLVDGVPVLKEGGLRRELIAALVSSCAELSTLNRNLHRLAALLIVGQVRQAQSHRAMLDTLAGDVGRHLEVAATGLAKLGIVGRSSGRKSGASAPRSKP
jgi:hypothetical protein